MVSCSYFVVLPVSFLFLCLFWGGLSLTLNVLLMLTIMYVHCILSFVSFVVFLTVLLVTHVCVCNRNVRNVVHADIWISVHIGQTLATFP